MAAKRKKNLRDLGPLGSLPVEQLLGLAGELQKLRSHPPLVKRSDGRYEGDILGFVKGLRFSARIIYFLRERLSHEDLEVSWGHLLDDNEKSCSPECDIIIHKKGYVRKWNGNAAPIMEFHFVKASNVLAVVSCKSKAAAIDKRYPKDLKTFGVKDIFLFAECCRQKDFKKLEAQARKAGYKGFWSLYFADDDGPGFQTDETQYQDFGKRVLGAVISRRKATPQPRSRGEARRTGGQAAASNFRRTSVRPKLRTKR